MLLSLRGKKKTQKKRKKKLQHNCLFIFSNRLIHVPAMLTHMTQMYTWFRYVIMQTTTNTNGQRKQIQQIVP